MTNLEWIAAGNTGCTFATLFARKPESVGWRVVRYDSYPDVVSGNDLLLSIEFPKNWTVKDVRRWALAKHNDRGVRIFSEVETSDETLGLRIPMTEGASWVQYFGPDSHVETRRTPYPMLMYTRKLNPLGYIKQVGFNGILHLAHAFSVHITQKMADTLWKRSYEQVKKKIGHSPTIKEAAKTTWLKKDVL
jgi:hypothetical protein